MESSTKMNDERPIPSRRWMVLVLAVIWIVFVCGLPLQTASDARHQAHQRFAKLFADGKPSMANIVATFDRSTQDVIAASTIPCLSLAVCIILLVHQLLKLKRRYNVLQQDLRDFQVRATPLTDHPLD